MKRQAVFAKQPILDKDRKIVAYELLYRDPKTMRADIEDDFKATVSLFESVTASGEVEDRKRYFINIDRKFLFSDSIELFVPERFVFEILEDVELDSEVFARIDQLRQKGFIIALDDVDQARGYGMEVFGHFDIVKIDLMLYKDLMSLPLRELQHAGVQLLAEKVETQEEFERTKELGFTFFQGYFFAKPQIRRTEVVDPFQLSVIRILQKIDNDASLTSAVEAIKAEPEVVVRLLQYLNSAFFSLRQKVDTVRKAVNVLGMKKLRAWLYLLLYGGSDHENPIFEHVRMRASLMEQLAKGRGIDEEKAYVTGLISLLDVVLELERERVFELINVDDAIKRAILYHEGEYGELLTIVERIERGEPLPESADPECVKEALVATL